MSGVRTVLLALLLGGCTVAGKATGLVMPGDPASLKTSTGELIPLTLRGPLIESLQKVDGHWVDVRGVYNGKRLRVDEWYIARGAHGMSVWTGTLHTADDGLRLTDFRTGHSYRVTSEDPALPSWVGQVVVLEGRQESPDEITAVYGQVLLSAEDL